MNNPFRKLTVLSFLSVAIVNIALLSFNSQGQEEEKVELIHINLHEALLDYEELTGLRIITDLNTIETPINIDSRGELTRSEAIEFLEKSFLLSDFVLVPSGAKALKLINAGSTPRAEGVPILTNPGQLIDTDFLVTYIMPFNHIPAEEAMGAFTSITSNHSYGQMTVLPDGMTLAITENSAVIQRYLELKELIDVPVEKRVHKSFCLTRSRAVDVAQQLTEFLGIGSPVASSGGAATGGAAGGAPAGGASTSSGIGNGVAANNRNNPLQIYRPTSQPIIASDPRITAIDRRNTILVMAHPAQIPFIEGLIEEFDAPASQRTYMTVRLKYKPVLEVLTLASDVIMRGEGGNSNQTGVNNTRTTTTTGNTRTTTGNTSANTNTGFGGLGGASSSSTRSGNTSLSDPEVSSPQSVLIGETQLIADPYTNELYVAGPPEHLEAIENLVCQIDKRGRAVYLETLIGQFNIDSNIDRGIDFVQTVVGDDNFATSLRSRTGANPVISGLTDVSQFGSPIASGLNLYGTIGHSLSHYTELLETSEKFRILQRPSVYAMNNEKAVIQTGQRIPIPGTTFTGINAGTSSTTVQYQDVVLRLEVIPFINSDDEVTLTVSQVNDTLGANRTIGDNQIPIVTTQELVTKVVVPNKATVLLGGIIEETDSDSQSGVPGLIHVPVLKFLTGNDRDQKQRRELMIFIQPHIISTMADLADVNIENVEGNEMMAGSEHMIKPGPIEAIVGKDEPYVYSKKVEPVEPEKFSNIKRLFKRKKPEPFKYPAQ